MGLTITKELASHVKNHQHCKKRSAAHKYAIAAKGFGFASPPLERPDRVVQDKEHPEGLVYELDTADGGFLRLPIIRIGNSISAGTL